MIRNNANTPPPTHLNSPTSQYSSKNFRCTSRYLLCLFFVIIGVSIVLMIINTSQPSLAPQRAFSSDQQCDWKNGPVLYNLRTKMGVNYDAGHWFHMAENFMTQHSILREKGLLTNASDVYYNFDVDGFSGNLNGMTRFMLYLSVMDVNIAPGNRNMHFVHIDPSKNSVTHANSGSIVRVDKTLICSPHQEVDLSTSIAPVDRFKPLTPHTSIGQIDNLGTTSSSSGIRNSVCQYHHNRPLTNSEVCMRVVDSIGGAWPTPQRGHWFPNRGDIASFRQKIREACPADTATLAQNDVKKHKKYKLVVYQRDLSRKLLQQDESITLLRSLLPNADDWHIQVLMHSSTRSPCSLAHILHNTDVLLTPHGFQSMLLLFLPLPSILFEIFPYKYYKRGYGPFGHEYGIVHAGVMSPPTTWHTELFLSYITTQYCMDSKFCRGYARNSDVMLTEHGMKKLVAVIEEQKITSGTQPSSSTAAQLHTSKVRPSTDTNMNTDTELLTTEFLY